MHSIPISIRIRQQPGPDGSAAAAGKITLCTERSPRTFSSQCFFGASYTKADGGRTIDLPLGDLLNPVYQSLNQLMGQQNSPASRINLFC